MWFLPPTTVTISTHLQIVHNTHNDMSRESLDITDQIKYELFALPSSGSRSVADLARSSPHPHSRMQTQQSTGRRPAGLPTSPGGQVNGISSAQCGRYPGLRDREGDIVLQWGVSYPDDSGFGFGNTSGCHVSFSLAIAMRYAKLCRAD
jgi:hypothetical protein